MTDKVETKSSGDMLHHDDGQAAFIYFEGAPVFASYNGIVAITLNRMRAIPDGKGGIANDFVIAGYLRCNILAARALRDSLDKALLVAAPPEGQPN